MSQEDALFLDGMVRQVRPSEVIELGVASGCSSSVLLRAIGALGGERVLHSYDVLDHCYMAPERPLGAAVDELIPEQRFRWRLHPGQTALDAGRQLAGHDVPLAFVDADHRHPWPSLDVLALLPALAADAWIVLHDISLASFSEWKVFGAQWLFEAWQGDKVAARGQGNVGAIRLPGSPATAGQWLKAALDRPWETPVDAGLLDALSVPLEARQSTARSGLTDADRLRLRSREQGRELLVWGAGSAGRACVEDLNAAGLRPDAFLDGDPAKHGQLVLGIPVWPARDLPTRVPRPFVVVASQFAAEIEGALRQWGFGRGADYLALNDSRRLVRGGPRPDPGGAQVMLGMTTGEEQEYLRRYTSDNFAGAGAIVDLGCWLGSTTISLARGLEAAAAPPDVVVHAYDTFVWHEWMDSHAGDLRGRFRTGDSFLPEFQRRLGALSARVRVHAEDLTLAKWNGGRIELLVVDAMKSWSLCSAINREFLPALVPGSGLLMHQDFKFWGCPWIHLTMYRLRDCFDLAVDLAASPGTVFRLISSPSPERIGPPVVAVDFSAEEIDDAYAFWSGLLKGPLTHQLDMARLLALSEVGAGRRVAEGFSRLAEAGHELPEPWLAEVTGRLPGLNLRQSFESWEDSLHRAVAEGRAVWMWGAGEGGRRALQRSATLRSVVNLVIDSDPSKVGGRFEGVRVVAPPRLDDGSGAGPFVVVATSCARQVHAELRRRGFERGRDFCTVDLS